MLFHGIKIETKITCSILNLYIFSGHKRNFLWLGDENAQLAFTCSILTIETLEQGVNYVQS